MAKKKRVKKSSSKTRKRKKTSRKATKKSVKKTKKTTKKNNKKKKSEQNKKSSFSKFLSNKKEPVLKKEVESKLVKNPKEEKKENKKTDKKKQLYMFLLVLVVIIGGIASYLFQNIYVYIVSGILFIYLIFLIIKRPKIKKQDVKKIPPKIQTKKIYITEFDKFYNYIIEHKSVSINKLSRLFKIPKKQVEEWAKILEGRGLIYVHYPLIGEPNLRCPQ